MVITRKRVAIPDVEALLQKYGIEEKDKVVEELKNLPVRQKAPPPPIGAISLREASRKYQIANSYLSKLVSRGVLPVILRTKNWLYINEDALKIFISSRPRRRHDKQDN
jgi:hypothetical protein